MNANVVMTGAQAAEWAVAQYGVRGVAKTVRRDGRTLYRVGRKIMTPFGETTLIEGEGWSWKDAVAAAAKKANTGRGVR